MSLYLLIDLFSISVPLLVSFHPRLNLYKRWKYLFPAIFLAMVPYIIWDIYFTHEGIWGFNEQYLSGLYLFKLPIEEWLFFVCIPYACIFTHYALIQLNKSIGISDRSVKIITYLLLSIFSIILLLNIDRLYTAVDMVFGIVILGIVYHYHKNLLNTYFITFLLMLLPFFVVNGILTGSGIPEQIVWYNNAENMGLRLGTIPVEDTVYAFSLILLNLFLFEKLKR